MILKIDNYLKRSTASSKLAVFRICFGLMMLYSMLRFWSKGWIETVYVAPKFHFKYYGFEWVQECVHHGTNLGRILALMVDIK